MATHSSVLALRIPGTGEPGGLPSRGSHRVGHDWSDLAAAAHQASGKDPSCYRRRWKTCGFDPWVGKIPWRRKWQPTPVFLPRQSHGQRSSVDYSPLVHKESETFMTEATCTQVAISIQISYSNSHFLRMLPLILHLILPVLNFSVFIAN